MKRYYLIPAFAILISCNDVMPNPDGVSGPVAKKEQDTVVFHPSHEERKKDAPFSDAVQVGNLYFLAGQVGIDNNTRELVQGGIQAETEQCLKNIQAVLEQHGMKLGDVVKATVILNDIEDFSAFNEVYVKYFPQKPARTTFAAKALAVGAKIEIEVVATKRD